MISLTAPRVLLLTALLIEIMLFGIGSENASAQNRNSFGIQQQGGFGAGNQSAFGAGNQSRFGSSRQSGIGGGRGGGRGQRQQGSRGLGATKISDRIILSVAMLCRFVDNSIASCKVNVKWPGSTTRSKTSTASVRQAV